MVISKSNGPVNILCSICNLYYQCNKFIIISIANSLHTFFLPHYYHFCLLRQTMKHHLLKLKIIKWKIEGFGCKWIMSNNCVNWYFYVLKIIHCISVRCKRCKVCYCRFLILHKYWIQRFNSFVSNAEIAINAEFLS